MKALLVLPALLPFGFIAGGLYFWSAVPEAGMLGPIWVAGGVFVLLVYVLVGAGIAAAVGKTAKIRRDGVAATAVVTGLADTGVIVNHQPQMRIDLDVHPPFGQPYQHSVRNVVPLSVLGQLRPGATLNVHIDRSDARRVVLEEPSRLIAA